MSGKSKTQNRKSRRSAGSNQQRTSSGSDGKGDGGSPAPSPSASSSSSLPSSNRSFKKTHNAQGGHSRTNVPTVNSSDSTNNASAHSILQNAAHSEPQIHGASDVPVVGGAAKKVEPSAPQRSTQAPSPRSASMSSDSTAPAKAPEDPFKAIHFQFGSIGMQIPVRTTTAPLNLDEQKHDQFFDTWVMEDRYSVNSPRRILSFSKRRRATVSFLDQDDTTHSGFGPKTSEVYGFVGSITTVVATVIFLVWAYVPERCLNSIGISYYPSRYWALAVPAYAMVTLVLALVFYVGLNFMSTPPPTSLNQMFDEFSRESSNSFPLAEEGDDQPIEPISDIGIHKINTLMFNDVN